MKNQLLLGLSILCCLLFVRPISAQTIEMSPVPDSTSFLALDFTRLLISESNQSLISGNFNLQYKTPINEQFNFVGELSLSNVRVKDREVERGLSNTYLGIQYITTKYKNSNSSLNFGIYLPTATEEIDGAAFNNLFDLPKYIDKSTTIHFGTNSFYNLNNEVRIGFELGSDIVIPLDDEFDNEDTELNGKYGISLMLNTVEGLYFQSEFLGYANITKGENSFNDSSFHTYAMGGGYNGDKVGAGVYYRNYFDDFFSDNFNGIFGIELNLFL